MNYLMAFTLFVSIQKGITINFLQQFPTISSSSSSTTSNKNGNQIDNNHHQRATECGIRPLRRQPRKEQQHNNQHNQNNYNHYHQHHYNRNQQEEQQQQQPQQQQFQRKKKQQYVNNQFFHNARIPKIIAGSPTKEGHFPWQASLELLHPSMGFLGHWCGGVLVDEFWVLSASHCVHNDLFNLPLPPLWTVVLGEYDRNAESGYEQRIPVEKIILHQSYQHFLHDLVLMKLSMPADLSKFSNVRKICLPFIFNENDQSYNDDINNDDDINIDPFQTDDHHTMIMQITNNNQFNNHNNNHFLNTPKIKIILQYQKFMNGFKNVKIGNEDGDSNVTGNHEFGNNNESHNSDSSDTILSKYNNKFHDEYKDLPYLDCIATGWGKPNITGDLSDILLKTNVPLQSNSRCRDAYGSFVKIHKGHLCAGKLNGKGGTCVGDSGGPLQCRLTKNGPWILAGITSFGSGCALEGYPDVYTRTSFYMKWIRDIIDNE
ncbi:GATA zinc finger domain-containing protein 10 [Condylostylus longicornis]|uniref:GATA zinc finger domain-containing protein 10 n=1 Tax=Condylostylus longicornis TaxID=2530218 RepID=UPI00244E451D|nr:GATA zinc finger domain-containing protein 10 [Condylostylus longicornis]